MFPTFVGLDCEVDALLRYQEQFADMKPMRPLHVTLQFLGSCSIEETQHIISLLGKVHASGVRIVTGDLFAFRKPEATRILMLDVVKNKELSLLHSKIIRSLSSLFEAPPQFHPHITVARSNTPVDVAQFESLEPVAFTCKKFYLYQKRNGMYEKVKGFVL